MGLLNQEPEKVTVCAEVWREAERGETTICTSFLAFTEVYRAKCEGKARPLTDAADTKVVDLLRQKWILPAVLDERIAVAARQLMRSHEQCKKPADAIHLATALALNVDELHTFDRSDLLGLDTTCLRADGKRLTICVPRPIPRAAAAPQPPTDPTLFDLG